MNKDLLNELLNKQIKNIPHDKKLSYNDLKRLSKYLESSIFDENKCSIWKGYITNESNMKKGIYINFYLKNKKMALHRILYTNFVGELSANEYLKFSCENKGKCCSLAHLKKFDCIKNIDTEQSKKNTDNINNKDVQSEELFILSFD